MNAYQIGFMQGMLDARTEWDLRQHDPNNKSVINPFDVITESQEYDAWWEGYNAHLEPKIVE